MITIRMSEEGNGEIVYTAEEKSEILGTVKGYIENNCLYIRSLEGSDFLYDGLCRALLFCALNRGTAAAKFEFLLPDILSGQGYEPEFEINCFFSKKNCL